jgi:hypothetical protein
MAVITDDRMTMFKVGALTLEVGRSAYLATLVKHSVEGASRTIFQARTYRRRQGGLAATAGAAASTRMNTQTRHGHRGHHRATAPVCRQRHEKVRSQKVPKSQRKARKNQLDVVSTRNVTTERETARSILRETAWQNKRRKTMLKIW